MCVDAHALNTRGAVCNGTESKINTGWKRSITGCKAWRNHLTIVEHKSSLFHALFCRTRRMFAGNARRIARVLRAGIVLVFAMITCGKSA